MNSKNSELIVINPKKMWFMGDDINTDLIIPSKYLTENDSKIIVEHAFEALIKNFSKIVSKGDIIVAGKNFGCGSSREEAVFVVKELGISAIIAESFSRIYFRNLINQGIAAIIINNALNLLKDLDNIQIYLSNGILNGINTKTNQSVEIKFKPLPNFLMNIINANGILNLIKSRIHHFINI